MDSVLYRRERILVKTIPKGTLLFRLTKAPRNDIRGVPKKDGTRCILSNHNVFFYPNPFVGKIGLSDQAKSKQITDITVFVLKNDVKVFWLLNPSKYTRKDRSRKRFFLKRCSTVKKGCVDRVVKDGLHASFNPCVSDTIIRRYPDVVGMIGVAFDDAKRVKSGAEDLSAKVRQYFNFATDAGGITSIPELVLHPLKRRPAKDVVVHDGDPLETSYRELVRLDASDETALLQFMQKHAEYVPDTYFYKYKN